MLYKPKFMSPDLNMDVKWAYYDKTDENGDIKPITFSCVCDGNSKITKLDLELTWTNIFEEQEIQDGKPKKVIHTYSFKKVFSENYNLYPIDYNNEYNEIAIDVNPNNIQYITFKKDSYSWKDKEDPNNPNNILPTFSDITDSNGNVIATAEQQLQNFASAKDKQITAKYILTSADGQKVYNYATFYFKSEPTLEIKIEEEYNDATKTTKVQTLSYSEQVFYGVLSNLNYFPVQYYYWEVYDNNQNKIFQSEKTYSQDIQFKYSNFINKNEYIVKCVVYNIVGEQVIAKRNFSVEYISNSIDINYSYKILPKETGIFFTWDKINILSGRLFDKNNQEISVNSKEYIVQETLNIETIEGTTIEATSKSLLLQDNYLSLQNIDLDEEETFYWAGYIHPEYNTFSGWQPVFSIEWIDNNNLSHVIQLEKSNNQELRVMDNEQNLSEQISSFRNLTYRKGTTVWYIIKLNVKTPSIVIDTYYLNDLVYPGDEWQEGVNGKYIELNNGIWKGSEVES